MPDLVRIRNLAPETRLVAPIGRAVEPDAVFDVPRDVFDRYEWPDELYAVETPRKTNKTKE